MNESKLRSAAMDSAGELPGFGNLLLRETGYPHMQETPKINVRVTKVSILDEKFAKNAFGAIQIDWSNDYHMRIIIENSSPEKLAQAFENASKFIRDANWRGHLKA